ncbi:hypothetical protein V8F20_008270 [Naviculisporaceae sp. PSN 640]
MNQSTQEADAAYYSQPLSPPSEFLLSCPKFRILVLGNPESTKQEIFSKVFGVDLEKKPLASAFTHGHDITQPLDLHSQNEHLEVLTSLNLGTGDQAAYDNICSFLESSSQTDVTHGIHCIWYCVSAQESRTVHPLEIQFFKTLSTLAPHIPVVLLFTKYDEFVAEVRLDWSKDAEERGLSKVAVSHILRDLATKKFERSIGERWDEALHLGEKRTSSWQEHNVRRVCVAGSEGVGDDDKEESFLELVGITLAGLRARCVKLAFAVAQRNSAFIDTQFCAELASTYFTVDTGHARKLPGIDIREMLPNFFAKCVQIFNMRDVSAVLADPSLPTRILKAAFQQTDQYLLLTEILQHSSTESSSLLVNNLSPHERAVLLVQGFTLLVLFLHKLADSQWPHRENFSMTLPPPTVTKQGVEKLLDEFGTSRERTSVLEMVEGSTVFTDCSIRQAIADLIAGTIELAEQEEKGEDMRESEFYSFVGASSGVSSGRYVYEGVVGASGHHPSHRGQRRSVVVVDDSDLQEISLSFVNDKSPDDVVLPCGLKILPLN